MDVVLRAQHFTAKGITQDSSLQAAGVVPCMIHNTRFMPASSGRCTVHDPQTQPNVGTCVVFTVKYFTANVGTWVVFTVHCADEVGVVFSST